jgi:hypothetical protein
LIKFHDFADNSQPGGDEASNEGCNSGSTGHDFTDNSNAQQFLDGYMLLVLGFSPQSKASLTASTSGQLF